VQSGGPPASSARGFDLEAALRMEQGSPNNRIEQQTEDGFGLAGAANKTAEYRASERGGERV
jgi:hypothetical protein